MNKQNFIRLLQNPDDLSSEELKLLEEFVKTYPYCQVAHILIAKASYTIKSEFADQKLKTAALYSISRRRLKQFVQNRPKPVLSKEVLSKFKKLKGNYTFSGQVQPSSEERKKRTGTLIDQFLNKNITSVERDQADSLFEQPQKTLSYYQEYLDKLSEEKKQNDLKTENTLKDQPESPGSPNELLAENQNYFKKNSLNRNPDKINQIIDRFIKEDPAIKPLKADYFEEIKSEDLTSDSFNLQKKLVSETFAKLLVKQGKIERAIEIYKELILKNPEKKIYFATRIEELKKQL